MTTPKSWLNKAKAKPKQGKKKAPETADEFQEAGVELEDAGGKWRAGDAAKSMRFFQRALAMYEQGLRKFPKSADLAYNKARVQLEMATHPVLVAQLDVTLVDMLDQALASHRYALELDPANADLLFNTAQLLTCIGEELASDEADSMAVDALQEALGLLDKCLTIQKQQHEQFLARERSVSQPTKTSGEELDREKPDTEEDGEGEQVEQWAAVEEAVTSDTLLDTALAQMATLNTMQAVLVDALNPELTMEKGQSCADAAAGLQQKLDQFFQKKHGAEITARLPEAMLTRAKLLSTTLDLAFRTGRIGADVFKAERDLAFAHPGLRLETSCEALMANARSLMAFSAALGEGQHLANGPDLMKARKDALTASIANLKVAAACPGVDHGTKVATHHLRGDASMRLVVANASPEQMLRNADVYYRNAGKLSSDADEKDAVHVKAAVARCLLLSQDFGLLQKAASTTAKESGRSDRWAIDQFEDMAEEGLLPIALL